MVHTGLSARTTRHSLEHATAGTHLNNKTDEYHHPSIAHLMQCMLTNDYRLHLLGTCFIACTFTTHVRQHCKCTRLWAHESYCKNNQEPCPRRTQVLDGASSAGPAARPRLPQRRSPCCPSAASDVSAPAIDAYSCEASPAEAVSTLRPCCAWRPCSGCTGNTEGAGKKPGCIATVASQPVTGVRPYMDALSSSCGLSNTQG